ncbi:MAG: response regulator transcription factor [Rhodospirillaceae bacterium]|nr:response regulator transcription factor [Rhodospirillaceae bacterium]MBL6930147.1 response regulator transcription factor [Rhodospirillales bacterium]MBL6940829.1 response regulator transcription factor [Rhodospirillales bacterium]
MRVLIVEDEIELAKQIGKALQEAGYTIDIANDGEEGEFLGTTEPYDAVVLDLGLPKVDGLTVLERWRTQGKTMPVLILTARETWSEKVSGFDKGADDYVTKPFNMEELLARLRALIRRSAGLAKPLIDCGPIQFDTRSGKVTLDGMPVTLTANELKVLSYLMHHLDRVVSRTELTEHIYDQDFDRDSNTIEVFIGRLRKKLGFGAIKTHRGRGYSLSPSEKET